VGHDLVTLVSNEKSGPKFGEMALIQRCLTMQVIDRVCTCLQQHLVGIHFSEVEWALRSHPSNDLASVKRCDIFFFQKLYDSDPCLA
jgi:hypothetical protein